jgi:hypothetical protein
VIVQSTNPLFFVSCKIGNNNAWEWCLLQVAFMDSMSFYPLCTLGGWFLFEFYICHPADWHYNAMNQHYWLQLHSFKNLMSPTLMANTHLVCPTDTSDQYAAQSKLLPLRKWLNISYLDANIHGPFDFVIIHGCKTHDHILQENWDMLSRHKPMFSNPIPRFDVPIYSIHMDCVFSATMVLAAARS